MFVVGLVGLPLTYINRAIKILPCQPGTRLSDDQLSCQSCPSGRFSATEQSTVCEKCPQGTYQSASGQSSCIHCPPNGYQPLNGTTECFKCTTGFYLKGDAINGNCLKCPDGARCGEDSSALVRVFAESNHYLTMTEHGELYPIPCQRGSCLSGTDCAQQLLQQNQTGLLVSCCSANRVVAANNPLCGKCVDGYSHWGGECVGKQHKLFL